MISSLAKISLSLAVLAGAIGVAQPALADTPSTVIGSIAHIDIMPNEITKVGDAFKRYMRSAPKEAGAIEIRMLQQIGSPNHFTLVEIWADKKSYDDHQASVTTRDFKRSIAPSLGSPYDERLHTENLVFAH